MTDHINLDGITNTTINLESDGSMHVEESQDMEAILRRNQIRDAQGNLVAIVWIAEGAQGPFAVIPVDDDDAHTNGGGGPANPKTPH